MSTRHPQHEKQTRSDEHQQQLDPSKPGFSNTVRNSGRKTGNLVKAGDPVRPDPQLATIAEAHHIATELIDVGLISGDVRVHDAEPSAGMPPMQGDFRPLLLTFTEEHPVTKQPVTFHVPAGLLVTEKAKFQNGEWFLEYDDRNIKRRPV